MKQITQNKLLKLIEEDRDCVRWNFERIKPDNKLEREIQIAKMDVYDKIINTLDIVKIVPESGIKAMGHCEAQSLSDALGNITMEPCDEPQRNDRFREFNKDDLYIMLDAKNVKNISMVYDKKYPLDISIYIDEEWCVKTFYFNQNIDKTTVEKEALAFYKDLTEWWKYWKQN